MKGKAMKMSFEDYIDFYGNPDRISLSIGQLNEIIHLHAFRKLYNARKRIIADALGAIDLLVPFRSTLKQNTSSSSSSSVFITVQEVIEDLSELQWHECSVRSISTVRSGTENLSRTDDPHRNCSSSTIHETALKLKPNGKRKASNIIGIATAASPPSAPASSRPSQSSC